MQRLRNDHPPPVDWWNSFGVCPTIFLMSSACLAIFDLSNANLWRIPSTTMPFSIAHSTLFSCDSLGSWDSSNRHASITFRTFWAVNSMSSPQRLRRGRHRPEAVVDRVEVTAPHALQEVQPR